MVWSASAASGSTGSCPPGAMVTVPGARGAGKEACLDSASDQAALRCCADAVCGASHGGDAGAEGCVETYQYWRFNLDPADDQTGLRSWGAGMVQLSELAFFSDEDERITTTAEGPTPPARPPHAGCAAHPRLLAKMANRPPR
jgi:hypothetical protein